MVETAEKVLAKITKDLIIPLEQNIFCGNIIRTIECKFSLLVK